MTEEGAEAARQVIYVMSQTEAGLALDRLNALSPGRHYGASADSGSWVMVGKGFTDLERWSTVPPAASLTFVWGTGGCSLYYEGGSLQMRPGDWMWVDAGFAHRGENLPGSDFLTVFLADHLVEEAGLNLAPVGAAAQPAPTEFAGMLTTLAVLLLDGTPARSFERPALDAILEYVGIVFEPKTQDPDLDGPLARARSLLKSDPLSRLPIGDVAKTVGLSVGFSDAAHLSRTFKDQYGITPSAWVERVNNRTARS